jgi:hypothetical protein
MLGDVFGQLVISTYDTDGATPRSRVPGRIDRSEFSAAKGREQKSGAIRVLKGHGKPGVGTVLAQDKQVRPQRHAYSKSRDVDGEHGNGRLRKSEWFPHSLERLRDRDVEQISDPPRKNEPKGLHEQFQRYCEGLQERINVWSCCICIILAAAVREDAVHLAKSEFVCMYFKRDFFPGGGCMLVKS